MTTNAANRLARICAYSSQAPEWEQLVRVVTPVVALAARRVSAVWGDRSDATVGEIVQNVFVKLCEDERRILREFEDRGTDSFLKLTRVITATVASDHFRRTHAEKRGGRLEVLKQTANRSAEDLVDAKAADAVQWPTLIAQLDDLLRLFPESVSRRDRNLFWLYFRHGMTAEAISRIPAIKLSAKGVESALQRLSRLLRDTIVSGKPNLQISTKRLQNISKTKGISSVVAINSMKDR